MFFFEFSLYFECGSPLSFSIKVLILSKRHQDHVRQLLSKEKEMTGSLQQGSVLNNDDAITRSCDFFIVTTHNYDFPIAVTRNYAVISRNYRSQCDRSYGVTAP